jgi:hypothetical protein
LSQIATAPKQPRDLLLENVNRVAFAAQWTRIVIETIRAAAYLIFLTFLEFRRIAMARLAMHEPIQGRHIGIIQALPIAGDKRRAIYQRENAYLFI